MPSLKVLIVEDSLMVQEVLKEILSSDPEIEVIGVAGNGQEGIQKVEKYKPDIITLDINMPIMNGLDAIEELMGSQPLPILVVSSSEDAKTAFDACSRGALEVFPKSKLDAARADVLIHKVKLLSKIKVIRRFKKRNSRVAIPDFNTTPVTQSKFEKVVAIACSTGGPKALSIILSELSPQYPFPIAIAQHMENGFGEGFAAWLNDISTNPVCEAREGDYLASGKVYICPPESNMQVATDGKISFLGVNEMNSFRPSCDILLASLAYSFREKSVGLILSGMADDGVAGIEKIKTSGGTTIAQDEESSVVFGMNSRAINAGVIERVLPLNEIAMYLNQIAER
jgi:two-component system, chemotaxis family, protein-glutamate methylesterase/glutaminase